MISIDSAMPSIEQHQTPTPPNESASPDSKPLPKVFFPSLGETAPPPGSGKPAKPRSKPYLCTVAGCEKAYSRPCLLDQHLRAHSGERPFKCGVEGCAKAFLRDSHLKIHMLSHTKEKPVHCNICGKGFNTNQHLNRHEKTHYANHVCPYEDCDQAFYRHSQLRKHISDTHTLEKSFKCPHNKCDKEYNQQGKLTTHMNKAHSVHPRYHCGHPGCTVKFNTWSALQIHIKQTHRKVPCEVCGKPCAGPYAVLQHMKAYHEENNNMNHIQQSWNCIQTRCKEWFDTKEALLSHYHTEHGYLPESAIVDARFQRSPESGFDASASPTPASASPEEGSYDGSLRPGQEEASEDMLVDSEQQQSEDGDASTTDLLNRITGAGYDKRPLSCYVAGCDHRFTRKYDLKRHMDANHPGEEYDLIQDPSEQNFSHQQQPNNHNQFIDNESILQLDSLVSAVMGPGFMGSLTDPDHPDHQHHKQQMDQIVPIETNNPPIDPSLM